MRYQEEEQKLILRRMDEDLLALLVVNIKTDVFEVLFTNGTFRDYPSRHQGPGFFDAWKKTGLFLMAEPDRERMGKEISKEYLAEKLKTAASYETNCRFVMAGKATECRIKIKKDVLEPDTLTIYIRARKTEGQKQEKDIYIRTFGRFCVMKDGVPVRLRGKAKEILALLVSRQGKEMSNEEIFRTIWENRAYSNDSMTVYYNALHRLKLALAQEGLSGLLLSTARGQMANTALFDCDYYEWLASDEKERSTLFEGEFLTEYSWSEYLTGSFYKRLFE